MTDPAHSNHGAATTVTEQKGSFQQRRAKIEEADLQCAGLLEGACLNVAGCGEGRLWAFWVPI